jgi:NAD(P)-dependent dehydrogenase (short-subunit alcohol dehydrogenase family)
MAGLMTGLGKLDDVGYTMAKWGVVALTRSFEDAKPNPYKLEGIKAYAICPWFADTQLVRDTIALDELREKTKTRILTVTEVRPRQIRIIFTLLWS